MRILRRFLNEQKGQVLVPALGSVLLSLLVVVPLLNLVTTGALGFDIHRGREKDIYSADSGVEHALWRVLFEEGFAQSMSAENPTTQYSINVNNENVTITVTKVVADTPPNTDPTGDQVFRVTKSVNPTSADPGVQTTYSYTIQIENMTSGTEWLREIQDFLPAGFTYISGTTTGLTTAEPQVNMIGGRQRLRWVFNPRIPFQPLEVQALNFQAEAAVQQGVYCNEAQVQPGNTTSGPSAKVIVGNPGDTACPGAAVDLSKTVDPDTAFPSQETTFTYTITIENTGSSVIYLKRITDKLPPDFSYVADSSSGLSSEDPTQSLTDGRWELRWDFSPKYPINPGIAETQTFEALATLDPGTYYNEVWILIELGSNQEIYSWPTAPVVVPDAFDIMSAAGAVTTTVNAITAETSATIRSWQIQ